eukprot:scaffold1130_cov195-Pinguiococcus_pyrenoidosus.AAC.61
MLSRRRERRRLPVPVPAASMGDDVAAEMSKLFASAKDPSGHDAHGDSESRSRPPLPLLELCPRRCGTEGDAPACVAPGPEQKLRELPNFARAERGSSGSFRVSRLTCPTCAACRI